MLDELDIAYPDSIAEPLDAIELVEEREEEGDEDTGGLTDGIEELEVVVVVVVGAAAEEVRDDDP